MEITAWLVERTDKPILLWLTLEGNQWEWTNSPIIALHFTDKKSAEKMAKKFTSIPIRAAQHSWSAELEAKQDSLGV